MFKRSSVIFNVILPLFLGILILYFYQSQIRTASDLGLGAETVSYFPRVGEMPIHVSSPQEGEALVKGWMVREQKASFLWLGNSQLHGVNQMKKGDANCVKYLFDALSPYNKEVLGISYPNANLQEFLVSTLYYTQRLPVKAVILPVFYDDMREDGIRTEIRNNDIIRSIQGKAVYFEQVKNIKELKPVDTVESDAATADFKGIEETVQETTERYLNEKLDSSWGIWKKRADFRGNLFNDLYKFRNAALGIKATTVRKMIPGRYQANYEAFKSILQYCKDKRLPLIVYIPPLRNDVKPPYDLAAYEAFKNDVKADCGSFGARFLNLENLVPANFWGTKAGTSLFSSGAEIDFMHFQRSGHQMIADTIFHTLKHQNLLK